MMGGRTEREGRREGWKGGREGGREGRRACSQEDIAGKMGEEGGSGRGPEGLAAASSLVGQEVQDLEEGGREEGEERRVGGRKEGGREGGWEGGRGGWEGLTYLLVEGAREPDREGFVGPEGIPVSMKL